MSDENQQTSGDLGFTHDTNQLVFDAHSPIERIVGVGMLLLPVLLAFEQQFYEVVMNSVFNALMGAVLVIFVPIMGVSLLTEVRELCIDVKQRTYTLRTGRWLYDRERCGSLDEVSQLAVKDTFAPAVGPGIDDTCIIGIDLVWHEQGRSPFPIDLDRTREYLVSCNPRENSLNRAKLTRLGRQDAEDLARLLGIEVRVETNPFKA